VVYPTDPSERVATLDDIYVLFDSYLGRQPNYSTEALPRVGHTYLSQMAQIRCSQEAANWRANHGAEPDTWCFTRDPVTGAPIPGVPPPPIVSVPVVVAPPPATGIPGLDALIAKIWGPIQDILARVNAVKTSLGDNIGTTLKPLLDSVGEVSGRITQTLADNITALIPRALELAAEAADNAANVAKGFIENAASVGDVAGGFIDAVKGEKGGLEEWISGVGSWIFENGINAALHALEGEGSQTMTMFADRLLSVPGLPDIYKPMLTQAKTQSAPFPLIPVLFALGAGLIGMVSAVAISATRDVTQDVNQAYPNALLPDGAYATAVARELRGYPYLSDLARKNGLTDDQFRLLADLQFQFPPAQMVTGAALRGAIDSSTEDELLNRLGFDARSRFVVKEMALQLPQVQDTIRMAVREVFSREQRDKLTLDAEYPALLTEKAHAIGLSEESARDFWAAHWELPSPNQVFEMLHRGYVTLPEVADYLKAADYAPVWRDRLRDIAYNVFTRVDIRRIHDLRGKDRAWLLLQHKRLGYNDADAAELSDFVELLNDDERSARRKELTGPLVSRIITNVVNGTLNDEQASEFFDKLGYRQDAVDSFLVEARLIRNEQRTEKVGNLIGALYVKDLRTRIEATDQLRERGFQQGEIDERFRAWDLEKELRAPTEREEKERDLTRSDIEAMYRARQLTKDIAQQMLLSLRYSQTEVAAILDLADFREKVTEDKDRVEVVHRKFVKGAITKTSAEQALGQIGLRATQIEASIARWELEVSAKTADLSVGQVGEVYQLGQWDDAKTRTYLARIGYDEDEIGALLRLWGSKAEAQKRRDEIAAAKAEEAKRKEAERVLAAARRADKALAVGQLLAAGAAGVLDWPTVRAEIVAKGYSVTEADTLIRTKQAQGVKRNA